MKYVSAFEMQTYHQLHIIVNGTIALAVTTL